MTKIFLVISFLNAAGETIPGDDVDGWSRIPMTSMENCHRSLARATILMSRGKVQGYPSWATSHVIQCIEE